MSTGRHHLKHTGKNKVPTWLLNQVVMPLILFGGLLISQGAAPLW